MKLQKFTRRGGTSELFNTSHILSVDSLGDVSVLNYQYFNENLQVILQETVNAVISSLSDNRKFSADLLVLQVLQIEGLPVNKQLPINLMAVKRGVPNNLGTQLICEGSYFGRDKKKISIQVSDTIDQIIQYQTSSLDTVGGISSLAILTQTLSIGDNLITHEKGSKVMGIFIEIDGVYQPWAFHFGNNESALSESEKLQAVYIPSSEEKTVNISLIF